jgi:Flp pilus assembly protein TadG
MKRRKLSTKERGFVILAGSLLLMLAVPMVGLTVDAGFMYVIKSRLASASDAAALAAARQLALGLTVPEQEQSAINRATAFFNANYPASMFNTANRSFVAQVAETGFRTRTVTITASVDAPLFFTRMLTSAPTAVVGTVGKASRRDVNVIMVLDRSGSMNTNGGCSAMRSAANAFVDLFANQRDTLGMITYGISYSLQFAPSMNFKSGSSPTLPQKIDSISCTGGTGTAQALWQGYQQIANINQPGVLNVILLFTDGIPNTISANFRVNMLDTTRSADGGSLPVSNKRSRCYDYQHSKRYTSASWNPTTQVYRGAVYAQEGTGLSNGLDGILGTTSSGNSDAGKVSRPYASETTGSMYSSSGYENDCWFRGGNGSDTGSNQVQYDIAYYPDQDLYGTSFQTGSDMRDLVRFGAGHPYAGKILVTDRANMMKAAINAVDNTAKRIRANVLHPGINTVVYAIGLGEVGEDQETLLRRVANDPMSPIFDETKLPGMYVFAPVASDLNAAFVRIASEILRYAQ